MGQYLDKFLLTLSDTQRQKMLELLEVKKAQGYIKSDIELKAEIDRLMNYLQKNDGTPTFQARLQSEKTNSANYNANLEEIAFDLSTVFSASNQVEQIMMDNQQLSRSLLAELRKNIYAIDSKVERLKLLMKNTDGYADGVHEQYKSPQYTETDETQLNILRKDRYGQSLAASDQAEIAADSLQLGSYESVDQLKNPYGRKLATIKVLNRTGVVAQNSNNPIDNAIDGSQSTYWAEVILADEPITQDIDDLWEHDYVDYPKDGAMCEFEITLNGITTVSEIIFDPYVAYPIEIVAIHGYESTDHIGKVYELVSPNHVNPHQRSKKSVGSISYQFPSVDVAKIRILIRQENYVKENYIVSVDQLNNMELWSKLSSSTDLMNLSNEAIDDKISPGETVAEFDKKNEITGWTRYLSALKDWASQIGPASQGVVDAAKAAMNVIRTGNYQNPMQLALRAITDTGKTKAVNTGELSQEWQAVSKLSYLYGFYNISLTGRKYLSRSIYVTKPLPISGNLKRISLMTEEKHHDIEIENGDQARITDIEYYITYKKNPDTEAWKPILPGNKEFVQGELLFGSITNNNHPELDNTIQFSFRFPIVSSDTVVLRRDGIPVPREQYRISNDGTMIGILPTYYASTSIYTVDYKPVDSAYFVEIDDTTIQPMQYINSHGGTGEQFDQPDDNKTVTLQHTPYVFRSHVFQYDSNVNQYMQDNTQLESNQLYYPVTVRVNGKEYKNITDYSYGTYDPDRLQTENNGQCFAQIGNKIYFPTSASGEELKNITVDYYYVSTEVRLKAILRRNNAGYESVTPSLYSWSLKCQTYDLNGINN